MASFGAVLLCAAFSLPPNGQATSDSTIRGNVREAASDSTKPLRHSPFVVSARRIAPGEAAWVPASARAIYPDDGSKLLLGDLRITSPLPASADLRLYGLPIDQTAREYVWGHRIGGPTTAVFGTRTKINPDLLQVALHPFLMSHRYRDTNGSLDLRPAFQSSHARALSLSSDAVERRATLWLERSTSPAGPRLQLVTSLRQSDVAPFLEAAVPELKVVPRYLDSQTHVRLQAGEHTLEAFVLSGRERGDWRETTDGIEGAVFENTDQNLAVVRLERRLPFDSKLAAGLSWEGDHVDSELRYGDFLERTRPTSHILQPRIEYSALRNAVTAWASRFCIESEPGGSAWQSSADAGIEGRLTRGWLTLRPSIAVQEFRGEATIVHGFTTHVHPERVKVTAGYATYADYFVFRHGIFGNVFEAGGAGAPQVAQHYVASVEYEPERKRPFDLVRLTGVRKDLVVDLWGARNGVHVLSWDWLVAKSGTPGWEIALLANDARTSEGPVLGLIPISLRVGIQGDLGHRTSLAIEANYRSGSVAESRVPGPRFGERFQLAPSHYLNLALTRRLSILNRPAHLTATVFNLLAVAGSRAELTMDEYGRRYDAPCWGNLRLRYDYW